MSDDAAVSMSPCRLLVALAVSGLGLLAGAAPVAADPAKPTDYRSEVTSIEPAVEGVTVQVAGGDGFLDVQVATGHEVIVEGYRGDPYLRFEPDGTVSRNLRSEATYINDDRYGRRSLARRRDLESDR